MTTLQAASASTAAKSIYHAPAKSTAVSSSNANASRVTSLISSKAAAVGAAAVYAASQATAATAAIVGNPANQTIAKDTLTELTQNISPKLLEAYVKTGITANALVIGGALAGVAALPFVLCCGLAATCIRRYIGMFD
jgi:hypothetical protein